MIIFPTPKLNPDLEPRRILDVPIFNFSLSFST